MQDFAQAPGLTPLSSELDDGMADILTFAQSLFGGMGDAGMASPQMMMLSVESIEWQSLSPVSSRWYSMRHLLAIDDLSDDLPRILEWAIAYKSLWTSGDELALNFLPLDLAAVGSIYEKPSTRTRISFEVGITRLGGQPLTLSKNDIQLGSLGIGGGHGEGVEQVP